MSTYNPLSAMPNADYKLNLKKKIPIKIRENNERHFVLEWMVGVWLLTQSGGCGRPKFPCSRRAPRKAPPL